MWLYLEAAEKGKKALVPIGYVEFCLCRELSCTKRQLQEEDADWVLDCMRYMSTEGKWREMHTRKAERGGR